MAAGSARVKEKEAAAAPLREASVKVRATVVVGMARVAKAEAEGATDPAKATAGWEAAMGMAVEAKETEAAAAATAPVTTVADAQMATQAAATVVWREAAAERRMEFGRS